DVPRSQRVAQRSFIMNSTSRGRNEQRAALHRRKCASVDQLERALVARAMQGDDVGKPQYFFQACRLRIPALDFLRGEVRIGREDVHAKGAGQLGYAPPDVSDP